MSTAPGAPLQPLPAAPQVQADPLPDPLLDPLPIGTPRTCLRRLRPDDLLALQAYRSDPEVGRWQGWQPMAEAEALAFLQTMQASPFCPPGAWFQLAIADAQDDRLIGDIGLQLHGGAGLLAELGFTLTPAAQGRGLATEAVGAALRMLWRHTPVQRVVAVADGRNATSLHLLQRLGLRCYAVLPAVFKGQACFEHHHVLHRHGRLPVTLRAATPADAAAVADLLIVSRRVLMPFAPSVHPEVDVRAWVAGTLLPAGGVSLAVYGAQGAHLAGVLAMSMRDDAHWIEQLFVHPAQAGAGVGAALLAHALARARSRRPTLPLRLYTFQANLHARKFYEDHGFQALAFGDGSGNEERCPDVLYQHPAARGRS